MGFTAGEFLIIINSVYTYAFSSRGNSTNWWLRSLPPNQGLAEKQG